MSIEEEAKQRDREREIARAKDALGSDPRQLVEQVFIHSNSRELNEAGIISRPLAYLAALMAQLSEQAAAATRANERLQKKMVWLTVAILALTAVMLFFMFYDVFLVAPGS